MSVQAQNWAYRVTLRPAEKFILVTLANYADQWGVCWPLQATLCEDTGYGERTVRDALAALESARLIARVERRRPDGSRQSDAFVLIGFDERRRARSADDHPTVNLLDVDRAASADTSNRQILPDDNRQISPDQPADFAEANRQILPDTKNHHSEPSSEPSNDDDEARARDNADFVRQMAEALGEPDLATSGYWALEAQQGRYRAAWSALGLSEAQMIAVARAFRAEMPNPPQGPRALGPSMARAAKSAAPGRPRAGRRVDTPRASLAERAAFWAAKIAGGGYVAPSAITTEVRAAMVRQGRVTEHQLRARGL